MIKVNAMGSSNPRAMVQSALERGADEIEVLIDNPMDAMEIRRLLEGRGLHVELQDDGGQMALIGHKGQPPRPSAAPLPQPAHPAPTPPRAAPAQPRIPAGNIPRLAILITDGTLGREDPVLGEILMKTFLGALARRKTPPAAVALLNGGVRLARFDTSSCDHLRDLAGKGARVLVSGACAAHFGISAEIGVGVLSDMDEILDALDQADKIITV